VAWADFGRSDELFGLDRLMNQDLPNFADELLKIDDDHYTDPILIHNLYRVGMLLEELARSLPSGSVWLGISRLPSPKAWSREIGVWNVILMNRAQKGDLFLCRVWELDTGAELSSLLPVMQHLV